MDTFDNDLNRMMRFRMNSAAYPHYEFEFNLADRDYEGNANLRIVDRLQIQFGDKRYGFLYRHSKRFHWCGYVITLEQIVRARLDEFIKYAPQRVTFVGPALEPLCWMGRNSNGKLKKPIDVFVNDYLVGFDMSVGWSREESMNIDKAIELLMGFENTIHRITENDLAL